MAPVEVVAQSDEWRGADDSDTDGHAQLLDRHSCEVYSTREKRLARGSVVLSQEPFLGDREVPVVEQSKEWADIPDGTDVQDADEEELARHAEQAHAARERRLTVGTEALERGGSLGDVEVEVMCETQEWKGLPEDSDLQESAADNELAQHAEHVHAARERRLTIGAEAAEKGGSLGDVEVEVVRETQEWKGLPEDSALQEPAGDNELAQHAEHVHAAREKRLTIGAEAANRGGSLGDVEVEVVREAQEWKCSLPNGADSEDETDTRRLSQHATSKFNEREKRLSVGSEQLSHAVWTGDTDVELIAQSTEWTGPEDSDVDEDSDRCNRQATNSFEARERRLTQSAEILEQVQTLGDRDIEIVSQTVEWSGPADSGDEEFIEERLDNHARSLHEARERRLSQGTEVLKKDLALGDKEIEVVEQPTEWACPHDSDDDGFIEEQLDHHASHVFERREKRLSTAAATLLAESLLGDKDVNVITHDEEWTGTQDVHQAESTAEQLSSRKTSRKLSCKTTDSRKSEWWSTNDDDDDLEEHAEHVYMARERRLTHCIELSKEDAMIGDTDVQLVAEQAEWTACPEACDEDIQGQAELLNAHAVQAYDNRERRLTAAAEVLENEICLGDTDIPIITQSTEWSEAQEAKQSAVTAEQEDALKQSEQPGAEEKQAEETLESVLQRRGSSRTSMISEELLLQTALAEPIKTGVMTTADASTEGTDDSHEAMMSHAARVSMRRDEMIASRVSVLVSSDAPIGDRDVEVVHEDHEYPGVEDSEDDDAVDDMKTDSLKRERRPRQRAFVSKASHEKEPDNAETSKAEATEVAIAMAETTKVETAEGKTAEVKSAEVRIAEVKTTEVKSAEVETAQGEATEVKTSEVETVEVEAKAETAKVEAVEVTNTVETSGEPVESQAFLAACRRASRSFDAREERLLRASRILEETESAGAADLDLVTDDAESSKHMPEPDFHKLLDQQIEAKQRNAKNAKGHGWLGLFCCQ